MPKNSAQSTARMLDAEQSASLARQREFESARRREHLDSAEYFVGYYSRRYGAHSTISEWMAYFEGRAARPMVPTALQSLIDQGYPSAFTVPRADR